MAPLLRFLVLLFLPIAAFADAVAGRGLILSGNAWAPFAGGAVARLAFPADAGAAFDGERFLVAWNDGGTIRAALLEEGAMEPSAPVVLTASATSGPIVRWDGSRYVVFWTEAEVHGAAISRQGVVETTFATGFPALDDAAVHRGAAALIRLYSTEKYAGVMDIALLDSTFAVVAVVNAGVVERTFGFGTKWAYQPRIASFGSGFYAVWNELHTGRYDYVVGARVDAASGPKRLLDTSLPGRYDIDLHPFGGRLVVLPKREWGSGITATFVDGSGASTTPVMLLGLPPKDTETVRLPDGSIAAVSIASEVATVTTLLSAPPPRRRAARH